MSYKNEKETKKNRKMFEKISHGNGIVYMLIDALKRDLECSIWADDTKNSINKHQIVFFFSFEIQSNRIWLNLV